MSEQNSREHRLKITVAWGDCDPAEIVFYPNFFRWFEVGTRNMFAAAGADPVHVFPEYDVVGLPLVQADARFIKPTRFGDVIEVCSQIEAWQRKTVKIIHRIVSGDELRVEGWEVRAWVAKDPEDPARLRAREWPASLKELLAPYTR
jgi:4-hydroxybenzoyl-CoA thioesterase